MSFARSEKLSLGHDVWLPVTSKKSNVTPKRHWSLLFIFNALQFTNDMMTFYLKKCSLYAREVVIMAICIIHVLRVYRGNDFLKRHGTNVMAVCKKGGEV